MEELLQKLAAILKEGDLIYRFEGFIVSRVIGDWCNGSTTDSGSVCLGSNPRSPVFFIFLLMVITAPAFAAEPQPVWDLGRAYRQATATRERICIKGLWRWERSKGVELPAGGWGYFKVP